MQPAETTSPKPFVFVLMPFDSAFDDTYQLGIRGACMDAGAYCQRVDEDYVDGSILDRVYNQIAKADIIVADMTGQNPNVFYEVGYAHALNKRVVLLTKNADDIPFDLKQYQHIVYGDSIVSLKDELGKRIRWMIENPENNDTQTQSQLQFFVNRISLKECPTIQFPKLGKIVIKGTKDFYFIIDINNSVAKHIKKASFELGLITHVRSSLEVEYRSESKFGASTLKYPDYRADTFSLPDSRCLHLVRGERILLPGAWDKLPISLDYPPETVVYDKKIEVVLRVFSDSGMYDFPFFIVAHKKTEKE